MGRNAEKAPPVVAVNSRFFNVCYRATKTLTNPGNKYFRWRQWDGDLNYGGESEGFYSKEGKEGAIGISVVSK